ncbi:lysozyme domain protein [Acinetobacter sp. 72431]|nr:lysozyme domain protein [Acinetobacter sp. 72431]
MNCKIEEIQRINKINDANKISEGQILKLPLNKGNNGEPKKINNSSNINNGVAKKDNHDDKDDHWFGTLAKAPDWMPDISADKIYNHIKDQILNSTAPELILFIL